MDKCYDGTEGPRVGDFGDGTEGSRSLGDGTKRSRVGVCGEVPVTSCQGSVEVDQTWLRLEQASRRFERCRERLLELLEQVEKESFSLKKSDWHF